MASGFHNVSQFFFPTYDTTIDIQEYGYRPEENRHVRRNCVNSQQAEEELATSMTGLYNMDQSKVYVAVQTNFHFRASISQISISVTEL